MVRSVWVVVVLGSVVGMLGCTCGDLRKQNATLLSQWEDCKAKLQDVTKERDNLAEQAKVMTDKQKELTQMVEEVQKYADQQAQQRKELQDLLKNVNGVQLKGGPEGNYLVMESDILFETSSADLSEKAKKMLETVAVAYLKKNPQQKIRIDGHTDGVPVVSGKWDDNWTLASFRAHSVMKFLVSKGLNPDRIYIAGWGPNKPLVQPSSPTADTPKNRRVEILLLSPAVKTVEDILEDVRKDIRK